MPALLFQIFPKQFLIRFVVVDGFENARSIFINTTIFGHQYFKTHVMQ